MAIIEANAENFKEVTKEGFTLVDFYRSTGCAPCTIFLKVIDELDFELPFVNIVKVETGANPELAREFKIMGVPTILFMKDGQEVKRNVGAMQLEEVKEAIGEYIY